MYIMYMYPKTIVCPLQVLKTKKKYLIMRQNIFLKIF